MTENKKRGRPSVLKNPITLTIKIDKETSEKANEIGGGNASEGIRIAVKKHKIKGKKNE